MSEEAWEKYKAIWELKTTKQIQKEIKSWRSYFQKYGRSYAWHGANLTAPDSVSDGNKLLILRELLKSRGVDE